MVAIVFGWIIAVVLLYILGVLIICKCIPLRREDEERNEEDHSGGSKEKEQNEKSKSSKQKESGIREEDDGQGKRKRKILESNPTTLEMVESEKPSNILNFNLLISNDGRE